MRIRNIGPLSVSLVGLGCNSFGNRIGRDDATRVVEAALESGVTLFDTADGYGDGASERILGAALAGRRDEAVIATKFGMEWKGGKGGADPDYVRSACEGSLRRLGTDHIDLYQLHLPDPGVPIEETLGVLQELVAEGKVRAVGHSNLSPDEIDAASIAGQEDDQAGFVCAQDRWNVLDRELEREKLPAITRHGLSLVPYHPLAGGLLSGKYRRAAPVLPSWRMANLPQGERSAHLSPERLEVVESLRQFAITQGRSLLELAISWLATQPIVASIITGATRPEQIAANATGATWVLTQDELNRIDQLTGPDGPP